MHKCFAGQNYIKMHLCGLERALSSVEFHALLEWGAPQLLSCSNILAFSYLKFALN